MVEDLGIAGPVPHQLEVLGDQKRQGDRAELCVLTQRGAPSDPVPLQPPRLGVEVLEQGSELGRRVGHRTDPVPQRLLDQRAGSPMYPRSKAESISAAGGVADGASRRAWLLGTDETLLSYRQLSIINV
jgi:hypothetical protein